MDLSPPMISTGSRRTGWSNSKSWRPSGCCPPHRPETNNPLAIIRQEAEGMQLLLKKEVLAAEEPQELRSSGGQVVQQVERCTEINL